MLTNGSFVAGVFFRLSVTDTLYTK